MKPIKFEGMERELASPLGMTKEECGSLPILVLNKNTVVSCWKMTWRERLKALITGKIWCGVRSGLTQPPVFLTVDQPFTITKP